MCEERNAAVRGAGDQLAHGGGEGVNIILEALLLIEGELQVVHQSQVDAHQQAVVQQKGCARVAWPAE